MVADVVFVGRGRGFCGSRTRKGAQGRGSRISWLVDEGVASSRLSTEPGRCIANGVVRPGIDVSMDAPLAAVALGSGILAT